MILTEFFTNIADALRNKKGTTDLIKATDFATEINNINEDFTKSADYQKCLEYTEHILSGNAKEGSYGDPITFDGSFYIPLTIKSDTSYKYVMKFLPTGVKQYEQFLATWNGGCYLARDNTSSFYKTYRLIVNNTTIQTSPEEREMTIDRVGVEVYLGGNNREPAYCGQFKFYYLKVYDSTGKLVNEFVPANSEIFGERILIDTVTNNKISY